MHLDGRSDHLEGEPFRLLIHSRSLFPSKLPDIHKNLTFLVFFALLFAPFAPSRSNGFPHEVTEACVTRYSTAIRTARPFVTCCKIPLCGPSAMSELISMPRF